MKFQITAIAITGIFIIFIVLAGVACGQAPASSCQDKGSGIRLCYVDDLQCYVYDNGGMYCREYID